MRTSPAGEPADDGPAADTLLAICKNVDFQQVAQILEAKHTFVAEKHLSCSVQ